MNLWRLVDTGTGDAFTNMAIDEAMMQARREGTVPPTVRFYLWSPPGLSLGFFQKALKEVDFESCDDQGIDIVRRITGGRAILHDCELTYSMVVDEKSGIFPESILESYKIISSGIAEALKMLSIPAELTAVEKKGMKHPRDLSSACFDAPSWYEVTVGGRKLAGGAQCRKEGIMLQHGSIPFSLDVDRLYSLFRAPGEEARERMKRIFRGKATAIWEHNPSATLEDLKTALEKSWGTVLNAEFIPEGLKEEEIELAKRLVAKKYRSREWNLKR